LSADTPLIREPDARTDPPVDGSALIRFEQVTKRFGSDTVLDRLDFSVDAGRHVTLIGPSGSGKTTILRLLMTLLKPDEGTITVAGEQLFPASEKQVREVRRKIGMVFQQFNLFPNMKVLRNITEAPVTVLGLSQDEARQRARELLDLVGLADKCDAYPSQLSGGSSSGWRSRGRWRCGRRCCCWTR
jgi:polar amino acid transport system ATP-binding protein